MAQASAAPPAGLITTTSEAVAYSRRGRAGSILSGKMSCAFRAAASRTRGLAGTTPTGQCQRLPLACPQAISAFLLELRCAAANFLIAARVVWASWAPKP